jgi:hypothetical protein
MLLALLFLVCLALPLRATTLLRYDLEELTNRAERVFVGTCQSAVTELIQGQLYTRYVFAVQQTVKGPENPRVELVLPGGQYQGLVWRLAGMPVFSPGEYLVLFLTPNNELGHAWPVGLAQGKFRVERHADRQERVFQELDGLSFYQGTAAAKRAPFPAPIQGMPLGDFLARVRALNAAAQKEGADAR